MTGSTLTKLAADTGIKLVKVPLDAGIDAANKTIKILTGVDSGMDISGATKELQARLDTLAEAMKNQTTQLKTGETAADFMELLAVAIKAANEVGSNIGPPLADEARDIIIELFKFGKSTAADLIGLIPVVGEVFDVLRIINSFVSTGISSVDSFVTSAELLMDGFDDFVDTMSGNLTDSDSKLLNKKSYNNLLESEKFKEKFQEKFGSDPPAELQALDRDQNPGKKSYVVQVLKAKTQLDVNLHNPKLLTKLLQGYANRRLQYHRNNLSSLKVNVKNKGIVPLVTNQTTSGLRKIHQNVIDAAKKHFNNIKQKIK